MKIIGFRVLSCDQHPDHDTIAEFGKRHITVIANLFLQVLKLCQKAGLVKMGIVSLDGTKIKAHANKSKSRTVTQLQKSQDELEAEIAQILNDAEQIDREENKKYGKGKKENELPEVLKNPKTRLKQIQDWIKEIDAEAEDKKKKHKEEKEKHYQEDTDWMEENGNKFERRYPTNPLNKSTSDIITSRRNPTDYDSRIMKDARTGGYIQGYNCQAIVDGHAQIVVAAELVNQTNDHHLAIPMLKKAIENTGMIPTFFTADAGYFNEREIIGLEKLGTDPYIPPAENANGRRHFRLGLNRPPISVTEFMKEKLKSKTGKSIYKKRKSTVEPVFGQIKECKGFRQFLLRGLEKAQGEWQLIALSMNLSKLYRARAT